MMWLKISLLTLSDNGTPEGTEQQYPIACSLYFQRAAVMVADSIQVIRFSWHDTGEQQRAVGRDAQCNQPFGPGQEMRKIMWAGSADLAANILSSVMTRVRG